MKKGLLVLGFGVLFMTMFLFGCANRPAVAGLNSFDEAMKGAVLEIGARLDPGQEVVVYRLSGPSIDTAEYISDELSGLLGTMTNAVVLARENAMNALRAEQMYQLSGMVSDASAVSVGNHLGAKVVVSGTLSMYEGFTQLRIRAVNAETSAVVATYDVRIDSRDAVLKGIASNAVLAKNVSESAITHLNRGKDLFARGEATAEQISDLADRYDERPIVVKRLEEAVSRGAYKGALSALMKALEAREVFIEAYRAFIMSGDKDKEAAYKAAEAALRGGDKEAMSVLNGVYEAVEKEIYKEASREALSVFSEAIAEFDKAIAINRNLAEAYFFRASTNAFLVEIVEDFDEDHAVALLDDAVADLNRAIQLNPNYEEAYTLRAECRDDPNKSIADYTRAIQINPNNVDLYFSRAFTYKYLLNQPAKAFADYTKIIELTPNNILGYYNRADLYSDMKDYDRAIADYEAILRINPNDAGARKLLEETRRERGR
jgi:tetratricopeptide (TPR) repeat protein